MRYRPLTTPRLSPEADLESPQIMEAAAFVESGEDHLAMLAELARYSMELAQAQRDYARARLAAVTADGSALNAGEDPTAAFNKIAQTVRRTLALQLKLKEEVDRRRAGLIGDRAARRARLGQDHASAVKDAIETALSEAYYADLVLPEFDPKADPYKPEPYEIERREMLDDAEFLLEEDEDHGDWLTRPVGETVARLCVALGLAPDSCVKRGETWMIRRPDSAYETILEEKRGSSPSLPRSGEGQTTKPSGWDAAGHPPDIEDAAAPHPGGSASCPAP